MLLMLFIGVLLGCGSFVFGLWWATPRTPEPEVFVPQSKLEARVLELTAQAALLNASGEYKRHWVYSLLQKEFPQVAHRLLGFTIEDVLRREEVR